MSDTIARRAWRSRSWQSGGRGAPASHAAPPAVAAAGSAGSNQQATGHGFRLPDCRVQAGLLGADAHTARGQRQ